MNGNFRSNGGLLAAVPFLIINTVKRIFKISLLLSGMFFACRTVSFCVEPAGTTVCFSGNACVNAELAETPAAREKGLMMRDSLSGDSGMLFVFERDDTHSFWMKNTLIPLDIIWIDKDCRIVDILPGAKPCGDNDACPVYSPAASCSYTLEVNAGFAMKNSVRIGDTVYIPGKCGPEPSLNGNPDILND